MQWLAIRQADIHGASVRLDVRHIDYNVFSDSTAMDYYSHPLWRRDGASTTIR